MTRGALAVRLGSNPVGTLAEDRGRMRFTYTTEALAAYGLGRPLLSVSLPTGARRFTDAECRPFFDGLLPEGEARRIIAYDSGLIETDAFGLLTAIGRECAGAVTVVEAKSTPEDPPNTRRARPVSPEELDTRVRQLRVHPLGIDADVRVSLTGWQEKLLVTDLGDQRWGLPVVGSASTHIIKPANPLLPELIVGEALCLRAATIAGVAAAHASLAVLGGRRAIVVERFDRRVTAGGVIHRVHQEDMCQATATPNGPTGRKYEEHGGPSLLRIAGILKRWGLRADLIELVRQVTCNVLFGNADAHAMNTSVLLPTDGRIRLAPAYDVAPTLLVPGVSTTAGMFVNGVRDLSAVRLSDVVAEAVGWGVPADIATATVGDLASAMPDAIRTAIAEFDTDGPFPRALLARVEAVARTQPAASAHDP